MLILDDDQWLAAEEAVRRDGLRDSERVKAQLQVNGEPPPEAPPAYLRAVAGCEGLAADHLEAPFAGYPWIAHRAAHSSSNLPYYCSASRVYCESQHLRDGPGLRGLDPVNLDNYPLWILCHPTDSTVAGIPRLL